MNPARREKILNFIGLGLLVLCFALSLGRIFGRYFQSEETSGRKNIRFSHWQLESGLRDAFDHLAADYMRLHPDVHVEQMPVPEQIYPNWLHTQLIGGVAPELIEIGGKGETNEILSIYFDPFTSYLEQPNPYNKTNDLAHVAWRDTFIDGLSHGYNQDLLQYFGIPSSMFTVRMFYNKVLWKQVFGERPLPATYEEMVDVCRQAVAYRMPSGEPIVPVAGSQNNAPHLVQRLFSSQTQRLFYSLARPGELYPSNEELALDYLNGRWSYNGTPACRDGLDLARGVGQFLPPGFLQLRREDALYIFSQGRALMTVTGSWDAPSLRSQAPFEVGVFDVPVPTATDPRYGHNTVGIVSEAGAATGLTFAMTKQSSPEKKALVVDFMHFLTSRESNRKFSDDSGWLPSVVGVEPSAAVRPFLPRMDGYPAGFGTGVSQGDDGGSFGTETGRVQDTNMYRLFEPGGGPAAYADAIAEPMRDATIRDLNTSHVNQLDVIMRQDTTLAAYRSLGHGGAGDDWSAKVGEIDELQTQQEIAAAGRRWQLSHLGIAVER